MMAKGFWVSTYREILDPDRLAAYAKLAGPAIADAGGRFIVRGGTVTAHESGVPERTVVIEFDSYNAALAAHETEGYQQALAALEGGVVRDLRIVEGVD
jgi:uncharacterized protein (DUF1330 family)